MRYLTSTFITFTFLIFGVTLALPALTHAATITAASCSQANVQSAVNSAADGDTVMVPTGSCTWSNPVTLSNSKGVSLICQAAGSCAITPSGDAIYMEPSGINNKLYRISGFKFQNNGSNVIIEFGSATNATIGNLRIDHNTFSNILNEAIAIRLGAIESVQTYYGVIDHNTLTSAGSTMLLHQITGSGNPGANSTGTANNMFVEDNTITITTMTNTGLSCSDSWTGATVWRHNSTTNCMLASHGSIHNGGPWNWELYGNTFIAGSGSQTPNGYRLFHHQGSGEILAFNNTFTASASPKSSDPLEVTYYRSATTADAGYGDPPGRCNGTKAIDGNRLPTSTYYGYPCWHQPGRSFSGTLTPMYSWNNKWSDTGGRIDMLIENPWGSTNPGVEDHLKYNRDLFNAVGGVQTSPTSPFNGTTGMGFGTLANRPTTCSTALTDAADAGHGGVGYFATDVGSQGTLYTCTATNTWTVFYTPYTYPHPLTTGGTPPPTDTTAPSTPTNLAASAVSSSQINLSWTASTDNVGVTGYNVYRGGVQVGTPSGTSYSDTGLTPSTAYSYYVRAVDAAGNVSGNSNTASATTQAGTPAPTVTISANPTSVSSGGSSTLTWSSTNATSCTASGGWSGSKATSGTQTLTNLTSTAVYALTCTGTGGSANNSVTITVTSSGGTITIGETTAFSEDDGGNGNMLLVQDATLTQTATIQSISFYVTNAAGNLRLGIYDATGPGGGPGALKAQTASFAPVVGWNTRNVATPVSLPPGTYWLAYFPSSNNLAFAVNHSTGNYKYANRTFGTMPATFPTVNGSGTTHWSLYATLSTGSSADTTAPSVPTNLAATAVSSSQINLTWTASTDNVGVTGYKIFRGGTQIGTSATNSFSNTGLTASTNYSYYVTAYDAAGNNSAQSNTASATTQASGFAITVTQTSNGTITPGTTSVSPGGSQTFTITPNANYNISSILADGANQTALSTWTDLGTQGGNTRIRAIVNVGGGVVVAGGETVIRSTNNGLTWTNLGALPGGVLVLELTYAGNNTVIAGTTNGRLFRSTNGGQTWTDLGTQYAQTHIYALKSLGNGVVLAGTQPGGLILRSTNYGATWTNLGKQGVETQIITFANLGGNVVLAGCGTTGDILRSTDNGITWTNIGKQFTESDIDYIAGLGNNVVIATTYPNGKLLRSTNNGLTFSDLGQFDSGGYMAEVVSIGGGVAFGTTGTTGHIWRTMDYGATWTDLGLLNPQTATAMRVTLVDSQVLLIGSGPTGKIFRATNNGFGTTGSYTFSNVQMPHTLTATYASIVAADTTAPSVPTGLTASAVSSSQINLSWTASTDNVGVTGYKIFRGGTQVGTSATNSFSNTGLSPATAYSYTVSAYDAAGNNSAPSTSASATTLPLPPTVVVTASPQSIGAGDSSTLSWNSTGATSCTGTNFSTAGVTSGSAVVSPSATTLYTVSCTGAGGTGSNNVTVAVGALSALPTISFPSGTFTWTTTNAVSCTATGGWTGSVATNGSYTFTTPVSTMYVLTCTGGGTTVQRSITITTSETATVSSKFQIGGSVTTASALNVRSAPSTSGTLLGSQPSGATGTVTGGPVQANGYWWWQINFASGVDGWSVENWLQ